MKGQDQEQLNLLDELQKSLSEQIEEIKVEAALNKASITHLEKSSDLQ